MRHPEEGEIHAWLDGALDPATAAGLEAHVAACPSCSAAVAEARGLIAGASRILMALDGVPGGVLPAGTAPAGGSVQDDLAVRRSEQQRDMKGSARRPTPWYARRPVQIAAGLMLVAGIGSVAVRNADRSPGQMTVEFESVPAASGPSVGRTAAPAPPVEMRSAEVGGMPVMPPAAIPAPVDLGQASNREPAPSRTVMQKSAAREEAAAKLDRVDVAEQRTRAAEDRAVSSSVAAAPSAVAGRTAAAGVVAPPPVVAAPAGFNAPVGAAGAASLARQNLLADSSDRRAADSLRRTQAEAVQFDAATGVIAGKVVAADSTPIGQAMVQVRERSVGAVTGADGSFRLSVPPGQYTIEARRIGYSAGAATPVQVIAGDTATTSLTLQASTLSLSNVVVTGSAARSAFAGACFVLDVNADATSAGIPLLPRRVMFRLSESGSADIPSGAAAGLARLRSEARRLPGPPGEPARPLAWSPIAADSVAVTWPAETDVVTLRLEVRGSSARGTARSSDGASVWSARVSGSRVPCAG